MKLCLVCNFQFNDEQELCPKDLSKLIPLGKDPLLGSLIQGRYRIESIIAKGSMGIVYKARQEQLGREVAIKVMHGYLLSDEESLKRYQKEAKAASKLNHPNITNIYDFGVLASGQPYIVMDLQLGKTLSDVLKEKGQLSLNQIILLFNPVCQALAEAHSQGVIHRDIKPENILITELSDSKSIDVKVVDFGIAKFASEGEDSIGKITKTGTVCGSPFYMSPEQCDGSKVDARSDLYSLGIVLFECLTGKVPFDSKDIYQILSMQVKDAPPRIRKVRPDLEFSTEMELFIARCLAKDPDMRPRNAKAFWDDLYNAVTSNKKTNEETKNTTSTTNSATTKTINQLSTDPNLKIDQDELKRKIQEATELLKNKQENAEKKLKEEEDLRRKKPLVPFSVRLLAFFQIIAPILATICLILVLFWVVANESQIHSLLGNKTNNSSKNNLIQFIHLDRNHLDMLVAQNKLDEAKNLIEKQEKKTGLTQDEKDYLDSLYFKLFSKEAKNKHYKQAFLLLNKISAQGKQDESIQQLITQYKKLSGN